ncbi:MAG: hypothetical protein LKJ69_05925 [Lactobacillus sp.]|jgi:cytoskeletal protein RodZ|nr:hypothetical protein [Lactobacillus sp.]
MGAISHNNLLVRELAVGLLLVIVLISFYIRYAKAAHRQYERTREHRMAMVIRSARRQLVVVLILLIGVLVYDRVLPHWGVGARTAPVVESTTSSQKQSATKKTPSASQKKPNAHSQSAQSAAASTSRAQSQRQAAAAKAASSRQAAQASAQAASASKASAARQAQDPKAKAVTTVQQYLTQHPDAAADRVDRVGVVEYSTDYNGTPAYHVGLYQTQADGSSVAIHMYFVYADGQLSRAY